MQTTAPNWTASKRRDANNLAEAVCKSRHGEEWIDNIKPDEFREEFTCTNCGLDLEIFDYALRANYEGYEICSGCLDELINKHKER